MGIFNLDSIQLRGGSELLGLSRLARGLRRFRDSPLAPADCDRIVRARMRNRGERFLEILKHAVFGRPGSPYHQLCRAAGVEEGDVRTLVNSSGVEPALEKLAGAGVRVSWEEFKGRTPVVRGGRTLDIRESDFDNPLTRTFLVSSSGGTSGNAVRVKVDLDFIAESAPNWGIWFHSQGWGGRPFVFWTPTHTGLANRYLLCVKLGYPYRKWFAMADMRAPLDRLRSGAVHRLSQFCLGLPAASPADLEQSETVMRYLAEAAGMGEQPLVNTSPSAAAKVSREAVAAGRSLQGVSFLLGAEPVTPERKRAIESSGAACRPTYGTSETGMIGAQFAGDTEHDEVRVFRDSYAVLDGGPGGRGIGNPLLFTTLVRAAPKILINAEIGDSAILQSGAGGHPASEWGYDLTMHTIRSFRKLTCFGVTLAVADLYPAIEDFLPRRFGGEVGDYQLVESQTTSGVSRLRLLVDPRVGSIDEQGLVRNLLREIGSKRPYYQPMVEMVQAAGAITVERKQPGKTRAGKVFPVLPATSR